MKLGKWELNKCYCEDSYKAIKEIPDKSVDLCIIDPPYEIETLTGGGMLKQKNITGIMNELGGYELDKGINEEILAELMRIMKKPNIYIWCNKKLIPTLFNYFVNKHDCSFEIISWHKTNAMPLCGGKYLTDTEYCLYFKKDIKLNTTYETASTHYELPINIGDKEKFVHPTIKPIKIIKNLIINSSNENDIVFDCFVGSGTTAVASQDLKRRFLCFDKNEKWVKISNDRLDNVDAYGQTSMFLK